MVRWEKGTRYYQAHIEKDLLGHMVVVRTNGRIDSKQGQTRSLYCGTRSKAIDTLVRIAIKREQRGYKLRFCDSLDG